MLQLLWALIAIAPVAAVILALRFRASAEDRRTVAQRLPQRTTILMALLRLTVWLSLTMVVADGFADLHRVAHGDAGTTRPGDLAEWLMLLAAIGVTAAPALLTVNAVLWLIPPIRRANDDAMAGTALSHRKSVLQLLVLGAILIPLGLAQGVLGALEPWARP